MNYSIVLGSPNFSNTSWYEFGYFKKKLESHGLEEMIGNYNQDDMYIRRENVKYLLETKFILDDTLDGIRCKMQEFLKTPFECMEIIRI